MNIEIPKNIFISATLILFIIFTFFYLILSDKKKKSAIQHYNQYIPVLDNIIEQIICTQHGYNNMFNSICSLTYIIDDYETLCNALKNYLNPLQNTFIPSQFLLLENKLLAALLFQKYSQANDRIINMHIKVNNPLCKSKANEFEILDAAGIIIDNALENSDTNDNIYITISQKTSKTDFYFHFIVENPRPPANSDFIKNIFTKGYTTKKSDTKKHGIGLKILEKTVNKYDGSISVYNTYRNKYGKKYSSNCTNTQRYLCIDITI